MEQNAHDTKETIMATDPKRDDDEQNTGNLGNEESSSAENGPAPEGGETAAGGDSGD